jgi:hypothetical protein
MKAGDLTPLPLSHRERGDKDRAMAGDASDVPAL